MGAGGCVNILDLRESSVENYCCSLWLAAVGIHAGLFAAVRARAIFLLLRRAAASGAHSRHRGQLSRAGVQYRARSASIGGVTAADAVRWNRSGAGSHCAESVAGTGNAKRGFGGRA